jgi:hypothetical protein
MWAVAVAAFNFGATQGAVTIAVAAIVYLVPATIFDWPRITLADIAEFVWAAIAGFFSFLRSLIDW